MWSQIRSLGLVALSALLAVEAKTFSDRIQEHANLRQKLAEEQMNQMNQKVLSADANYGKYRFLNSNTTKYQVTSLPDVNYDIGEMYAGNIPINYNEPNRTLFFVFQPTIGKPVDEVTVWLNGGPGCSSMDGFFQENGRFLWQPGVPSPQINPYSWVNLTNMLWVDQPVGTGYTTGQARAKSQEDIAKDFADFFKNFQTTFGIKKFKIYVTGESYAGRYVPYISAEMLNRKNTDYYNLKGAIVYDPVIGAFTYTQEQVPVVPYVTANNNLFNFNQTYLKQLQALHKKCGYEGLIDKYYKFPPPGNQPAVPPNTPAFGDECDVFDSVNNEALGINPCFNIYEVNQQCPILWTVIGFPTELVFQYPGTATYFNRADVKKALHAPANVTWAECKGPVFFGGVNGTGGPQGEGDLSADPIQKVLPQVIEATNRVLVGNGDLDMIIISKGTVLAIQNMTWNGKLGFQKEPTTPVVIELPDLQYAQVFADNGAAGLDGRQGVQGIQHYERGLMYTSVTSSGHMQPQFQPRSSYRHIQWLLGYTDTL